MGGNIPVCFNIYIVSLALGMFIFAFLGIFLLVSIEMVVGTLENKCE